MSAQVVIQRQQSEIGQLQAQNEHYRSIVQSKSKEKDSSVSPLSIKFEELLKDEKDKLIK